jgi:hypothetical protein
MAQSQAVIVRAFPLGKSSTVITIPKTYEVERGTPFFVEKDEEGKITYTPISRKTATESAT